MPDSLTSIETQLSIKIDQAMADIKNFFNEFNEKAKESSKQAGVEGGNQFKQAFEAILATISFDFLVHGIQDAVKASIDYSKATTNLNFSIEGLNKQQANQISSLREANGDIVKEAEVLGISTDKLYKKTSATGASSTASAGLRDEELQLQGAIDSAKESMDRQNESLQQNLLALQDQVDAIEKEKDAQLAAIDAQNGGQLGQLKTTRQSLNEQINTLKTQKDQNALQGFSNFQIDYQLQQLQKQKVLNDDRIAGYDLEITKVKDLAQTQESSLKTQINELQRELQKNNMKLQLDIKPFEDQLTKVRSEIAQVRSSAGGGGGGEVIDPKVAKEIEDAKNRMFNQAPIDENAVDAQIDRLYEKTKGVISKQDLSNSFLNLFNSGVANVDDASKLIERFTDAAAEGGLASKSFAEKFNDLSQGFALGNTRLLHTSGLTVNMNEMERRGLEILQSKGELQGLNVQHLTEAEKRQAALAGILEVSQNKQGAFNRQLELGNLEFEQMDGENRKLQVAFGQALAPAINKVLKFLMPLIQGIVDFISKNPELVAGIVIVVTVFIGLLTIIASITATIAVLTPAFIFLGTVFTAISAPILLVVLAIGALVVALIWAYNNVAWFRDMVNDTVTKIVNWFIWAKDHWIEALGEVIGFFITLPERMTSLVGEAVKSVLEFLSKVNWDAVWTGLFAAASSVWDKIVDFFSHTGFDKMREVLKDLVKGVIKGILSGIPGVNADDTLKSLGLYAQGGYFTKPTLGVFAEAGDEALLNKNAIAQLGLTPELVAALNKGNNSNTNNSNTNVSGSYNRYENNYVFGSTERSMGISQLVLSH